MDISLEATKHVTYINGKEISEAHPSCVTFGSSRTHSMMPEGVVEDRRGDVGKMSTVSLSQSPRIIAERLR